VFCPPAYGRFGGRLSLSVAHADTVRLGIPQDARVVPVVSVQGIQVSTKLMNSGVFNSLKAGGAESRQ
jgi:hypothetical protein